MSEHSTPDLRCIETLAGMRCTLPIGHEGQHDLEHPSKDLQPCTAIEHRNVVRDAFSKLPGVRRTVPGDCYCLNCHAPVPLIWNGGNIKQVEA